MLGGGGKKKKKKRRHRTIFTSYQVIEDAIYIDLCLDLCLLGALMDIRGCRHSGFGRSGFGVRGLDVRGLDVRGSV